ncbi:hypothetical protein Gotur_003236 [Gossypium turneri]
MGICDAVAVAKILNATLVIPYLEVNPVWQDSSSFMDIFDVDHFINVLKDDISIVKELPDDFSWSTREYYATAIRPTRIKRAPVHASANWYLENVLPVLQRLSSPSCSVFLTAMGLLQFLRFLTVCLSTTCRVKSRSYVAKSTLKHLFLFRTFEHLEMPLSIA